MPKKYKNKKKNLQKYKKKSRPLPWSANLREILQQPGGYNTDSPKEKQYSASFDKSEVKITFIVTEVICIIIVNDGMSQKLVC